MKGSDVVLIGAGLTVAFLLFTDEGKAILAKLGIGGAGASGGAGGAGAATQDAAAAEMAQKFRAVGINPAMMQAKYNEFTINGINAAAALMNVPSNAYTRNTPTALPFTASELQQQQAGLIRLGEAIGTVGVIAPKYTPNATIEIGNGNFIRTDNNGNIVSNTSVIASDIVRNATNQATASGQTGAAAVEAVRQAELAAMGRHD